MSLVGYNPIKAATTASVVVTVTGTSQQLVVGGHYLFTNTSAQTTATMPLNPMVGDEVTIDNATGRLDLILLRNSQLFHGLAEDINPFNIEGCHTFKFVGGTQGWRFK